MKQVASNYAHNLCYPIIIIISIVYLYLLNYSRTYQQMASYSYKEYALACKLNTKTDREQHFGRRAITIT